MRRFRCPNGGALVIVLLFLLLIDAVVLTTLHMAVLERRVAANASAALRLRLAAGSAAGTALLPWPAALDSLRAGAPPLRLGEGTTADGLLTQSAAEVLAGGLLLVRAGSREPPPGHGRAAAASLWLPPVVPSNADAAAAAVSATSLHMGAGAVISAETDSCSGGAAVRSVVPIPAPQGSVQGGVETDPDATRIAELLPRMLARSLIAPTDRVLRFEEDSRLTHSFTGIVLAAHDLIIAAGAEVRGLVVAGGTLTVESGAAVNGSVHARGAALVEGSVALAACVVHQVLAAAAFERPLPLPQRPLLPGF